MAAGARELVALALAGGFVSAHGAAALQLELEPGAAAALQLEPGAAAALQLEPGAAAALQLEPGAAAALQLEPGAAAALQLEPGAAAALQLELEPAPGPGAEPGGAHLAFFGFAPEAGVRLLVRALQLALAPALLHAALVSDARFEGILSGPRGGARAQRVLALFKMHIGVVELDAYMSDGMAACLRRIAGADGAAVGNLFQTASLRLFSDLRAHDRAKEPAAPPALPVTVALVFYRHGAQQDWLLAPPPGYEARYNAFLHAHSVLYTPSHVLHAAPALVVQLPRVRADAPPPPPTPGRAAP